MPSQSPFKANFFHDCHDAPFFGHVGYNKTYSKVRKSFFWPNLKSDVLHYVRECLHCQQVKIKQHRMPGLMQPLEITLRKWESISMDFITKLSREGYDKIFVVVYHLTKMAHFFPMRKTDGARGSKIICKGNLLLAWYA